MQITPDPKVRNRVAASSSAFIRQNLTSLLPTDIHCTSMTTTRPVPKAADYVIVGGGTAGLVLANRLSEDPNTQILVLESGKSITQDPTVQDPSAWTSLLGPETAWQLETISQVREYGKPSTESPTAYHTYILRKLTRS